MVRYTYYRNMEKCPHCRIGKLLERVSEATKHFYPYGLYDCDDCGREWEVLENGKMVSHGATDKEIYCPKTDELKPYHCSTSNQTEDELC